MGVVSGAVSAYFWSLPQVQTSDFSQVWAAARALRGGLNPYDAVGPGRGFDFPWATPYPMPAVYVALPFSFLPLSAADPLFVGMTGGVLAWVLTRERVNDPRLLVFASFAYLAAVQFSQWGPILMAAALVPALGFFLAAKPSIAAALWMAYPSWKTAISALAITVLSLVLSPGWIDDWRRSLPGLTHLYSPILLPGGPLILLGLLRWRLPEARLLVSLACVPQSTFVYEALPLFLIARRVEEAALLSAATVAVRIAFVLDEPFPTYEAMVHAMGRWMVWFIYLPCVLMVLNRPNHRPAT